MDIILKHGLEAWVHSGDDWRTCEMRRRKGACI
jgi:hypothetical protein